MHNFCIRLIPWKSTPFEILLTLSLSSPQDLFLPPSLISPVENPMCSFVLGERERERERERAGQRFISWPCVSERACVRACASKEALDRYSKVSCLRGKFLSTLPLTRNREGESRNLHTEQIDPIGKKAKEVACVLLHQGRDPQEGRKAQERPIPRKSKGER